MIIDQPVAVDAVEKQGGVEIAEEIPTNELYGFAMAPDNTALLDAVNGALVDDQGRRHADGVCTRSTSKTDPPASVLEGTTDAGRLSERPDGSSQSRTLLRRGAPAGAPRFSRRPAGNSLRALGTSAATISEDEMDFIFDYYFDFSLMGDEFDRVLDGFWLTLKLSIVSGVLSLIWGLVLAVLRQLPGQGAGAGAVA